MALAIKYRTTGPWGTGQGANLTAAEFDGNNWEFERTLDDLIANPPVPVSIAAFGLNGLGLLITMSDGTTAGPIPLPVLSWRWRGDWTPSTPYLALDVFRVSGLGLFLVLLSHTSDLLFDALATDGDANFVYQQLLAVDPDTVATGVVATGTNQFDAITLTAQLNVVETVESGAGVRWDASSAGRRCYVRNSGENALKVYPLVTAEINSLGVNEPIVVEPDTTLLLVAASTTAVFSVP